MSRSQLSTAKTLPPVLLCERCRALVNETLSIIAHSTNRHEVLSPADMLAIEAADKGLNFHMKDGRKFYEIMALKDVLADYPGLFFRVNRNWIVANDMVAGYIHDAPGKHSLTLVGSKIAVPVSRREWSAVAERLGVSMRVPMGRSTPLGAARMRAGLTYNRKAA